MLFTDGYPNDNSPESKILQLCQTLSTKFVDKQIVGYSLYYNRNLLIKMAETIGGFFSHVSDNTEVRASYQSFVEVKKSFKVLDIPKNYDLLWQVTPTAVNVLTSEDGKTVKIAESDVDGELYGVDYSELENLPETELSNLSFVLSLAFVLSQKNKANLGVALLRKVGLLTTAKLLQKGFTVQQKGQAENILKAQAIDAFINKSVVVPEAAPKTVFVDDFLDKIVGTNIRFDLSSKYKAISRGGGEDLSKVKFVTSGDSAYVTDVTRNENRANISLQTVRKGQIVEIKDEDLRSRVEEYNKTSKTPITLPIESSTFRNYALVANGDFNFDTLAYEIDNVLNIVSPSRDIDLFDTEVKEVTLDRFAGLYKSLLSEKAHLSVLNWYLKNNTDQKHEDDLRVKKYGTEGAALLEEMGLDYKMRYAPKQEYKKKDEAGDYIPFLEITGQLKGAATISVPTSYEKSKKEKVKTNVGDEIVHPFFKQYDKLKEDLEKEDFIQTLRDKIASQKKTLDRLQAKVSSIKFYLISTNSWFSDAEKADELLHEGVVIKTKTVNEYLS